MTDYKKPGVPFWATVVVVVGLVPLAYLLSIGPAFWIITQFGDPVWMCDIYRLVYAPTLALADNSRQAGAALERYIDIFR